MASSGLTRPVAQCILQTLGESGTPPERGVRFLGNSSLCDPGGRTIARLGTEAGVIRAEIDPALARTKRRVTAPGLEVDRFRDRRPSLYGDLVDPRLLDGEERR